MKFGTDGFRGPADSVITPDFCLRLGFHTGAVIKEKGYDSVIILSLIHISEPTRP